MNRTLLLSALLLSAPAAAADPKGEDEAIVITAIPLAETERALKDCLARKCPPNEDIGATLAHAENLFVAGDYKKARHATLASIGRNGKHAKAYPEEVSDLYRANGRIAAHLGEGKDYRWSTTAIKRSLKAGVAKDDPRLLGADFESAGMYASLGRTERARQIYRGIEQDSKRIGRPDLAATARVRAAWLHELNGDTGSARARLRAVAADRTPAARVARLTALVLLARLDRRKGDTASSDALIAELRGTPSAQPLLLYSPPIKALRPVITNEPEAGSVLRMSQMDDVDDVWVDIGFWVTPAGKVEDAEILRNSGGTRWTDPLLRSIGGRIYSPTAEGSYRVERYSRTALWTTVTGSRLRVREPNARIEFLDLTADPAPQTK